MADSKAKKLDRILRVRTLQLGQVRAEEMRARERFDNEVALRNRIAALADNIAPVAAVAHATDLRAAAHYRDRLHQSADAATVRVAQAEAGLGHAREATKEARRDQNAIEKLIERADAAAVVKAMRALEELPALARKRHDPC